MGEFMHSTFLSFLILDIRCASASKTFHELIFVILLLTPLLLVLQRRWNKHSNYTEHYIINGSCRRSCRILNLTEISFRSDHCVPGHCGRLHTESLYGYRKHRLSTFGFNFTRKRILKKMWNRRNYMFVAVREASAGGGINSPVGGEENGRVRALSICASTPRWAGHGPPGGRISIGLSLTWNKVFSLSLSLCLFAASIGACA